MLHKKNAQMYDDDDDDEDDEDDSNLHIKRKIYVDILRRTKDALDSLNIPFFLSSGTCLGYLREGAFIQHDYDIDIGIFEEDYTPEIINRMANEGLLLYRILGSVPTGYELSFRMNGTDIGKDAKIDIFLHKKNKKTDRIIWSSRIAPQFTKKITYSVPSFGLKEVDFMGIKVNVPYPTIKYIRSHYGDNWYIPIKSTGRGGEYDYRKSPVSIVKN
jgi:phosphorylcholine metabolism protein LicD